MSNRQKIRDLAAKRDELQRLVMYMTTERDTWRSIARQNDPARQPRVLTPAVGVVGYWVDRDTYVAKCDELRDEKRLRENAERLAKQRSESLGWSDRIRLDLLKDIDKLRSEVSSLKIQLDAKPKPPETAIAKSGVRPSPYKRTVRLYVRQHRSGWFDVEVPISHTSLWVAEELQHALQTTHAEMRAKLGLEVSRDQDREFINDISVTGVYT